MIENEFRTEKMAAVIDASLHRQESGALSERALNRPRPFQGRSFVAQCTAPQGQVTRLSPSLLITYHSLFVVHKKRVHHCRKRPAALGHLAHDANAGRRRY